MSLIEFSIHNHIATITLNDPRRRNCLSSELIAQLLNAIDSCEEQHARVIVLKANTGETRTKAGKTLPGVWSAGHNVKEIPTDKQDPVTWNVPYVSLLRRVRHCLLPVIASIDGTVWGGACDLAVSCDMIVATTNVTFAITPAKLGLPYNTAGVSHFLGGLPLHIVKEMFMTAQPLSVEKAHNFGMVNRLAEPDHLEEETMKLAQLVAKNAPLCIRVLKAEMAKISDSLAMSAEDFEQIQMLRREAFRSHDFQEGINAFHEKRSPNFLGR